MSDRKKLLLLSAEDDRASLAPLLEALQARGCRVVEGAPGKNDAVLAVLSEHFYADEALCQRLLELVGAGSERILPLQLDGAPVPDALKNALYASNIIPAQERDAALLAERILATPEPAKKKRLPLLIAAAALVLIAVVGGLIWRANQQLPEEEEAVPVIAETTETPLQLPAGITQAELNRIDSVVIIGDEFYYSNIQEDRITVDDFAYGVWEDDAAHWYSKADGHEYTLTAYADLHFLGLMGNLAHLDLVLVEADEAAMPDGAGLLRYGMLHIEDCAFESLEWLRGSGIGRLDYYNSSATDFSPLTDCRALTELSVDLAAMEGADFSRFSPNRLERFSVRNGGNAGTVDFSGLKNCHTLRQAYFQGLTLPDIGFLSGLSGLQSLELWNLDGLRDVSALSTLSGLESLIVFDCPALRDLSPISGCGKLRELTINSDAMTGLKGVEALSELKYLNIASQSITDFSPIGGCGKLQELWIDAENLHDLSCVAGNYSLRQIHLAFHYMDNVGFFTKLAGNAGLGVTLNGQVGDYSGLAGVKKYAYLCLGPWYDGDLAASLPYLQDCRIDTLALMHVFPDDWERMPEPAGSFHLMNSTLTDLSGMPAWGIESLWIQGDRNLRSLDGIEALTRLRGDNMSVNIDSCPLLTDVSALEGARLRELNISNALIVPSLSGVALHNLTLENIAELEDLRCLEGLNAAGDFCLTLAGVDNLTDLTPLYAFHGDLLAVPPQLEAQAAALVEEGNFQRYELVESDSYQNSFDLEVELRSLDELDTMPAALLRHVSCLCVLGDEVTEPYSFGLWRGTDPQTDEPVVWTQVYGEDEVRMLAVEDGAIRDLESLSALTGLRELYLYAQPLRSLDGIQVFTGLERLDVSCCTLLEDASAAFACPQLTDLSLADTAIDSIQGVQNLRSLQSLNVNGTKLTDLSPLAACDFTAAMEQAGGFRLCIHDLEIGDYTPLSAVPAFQSLGLNNADPKPALSALENVPILSLDWLGFNSDSEEETNALFAALMRAHPELTQLWIGYSLKLTDLSPALESDGLRLLNVSADMAKAIESLAGCDCRFDFQIEGN